MKIPHATLSLVALQDVVEEYVTRDGTDHSRVKQRVVKVMEQLENSSVELHFDNETGTCNIVTGFDQPGDVTSTGSHPPDIESPERHEPDET